LQWALIAVLPVVGSARTPGPPIMRTGAPVDGGLNCTACHRTFAANSGAGRLMIQTPGYTPGVKQTVTVTIQDTNGQKWGFQLTARLKSDETKQAGTFAVNDFVQVLCAPDGRQGPCSGALEFAEHNTAGTRPGTPSPGVFTMDWTPPATDMGEIVFYAAGNAANNSSTNAGDYIYTTSAVVRPACNLTQKSVVSGGGDGGSFRPLITSNGLISIFGTGFASATGQYRAVQSDLVDAKLPTEFGCVAVEIGGKRAPLFYVQNNQINAQAPILNASGQVDAVVIVNAGTSREMRSDPAKIQMGFYSPAWFTLNGKSIAAINASRENAVVADPSVHPQGSPAKPGDVVVLFGTGFGYTDPVWQPGEFATKPSALRDAYTVTVGGVPVAAADILYAGTSPDAPGLYQFNIRLSTTLADGDVPVVVRIGGVETQAGATIPVKR
jgi:uncharacterized protein (TIGR03437 family)